MTFLIRLANDDDAESIASLMLNAFLEFEHLYTSGSLQATTTDESQILIRLQEGPIWVALDNDEVVGTVTAQPRGNSVFIRGMAVLPKARGKGIGESLLKTVEHWARARNFSQLTLCTTPFFSKAIRLYENFGFVFTAERGDLYGIELLNMEKKLNSGR